MAALKSDSNSQPAAKTVKVAAIQAPSIFKDTTANIRLFTGLIKEAAANGAKFIVLPEAAITGYASQDFKKSWCIPLESRKKHLDTKTFTAHDPEPYAELKDGEMVQYFQKLCKELSVYLTVPYVEKVQCDINSATQQHTITFQNKFFEDYKCKYYNSISLIDPNGDVVGHYRKTNLWPYYDYPWATPGNQLVTVNTEYGKVGLGVCFDIHKILPGYKELNIWTLLYCIAWVDDAQFTWFGQELPEILKQKGIPYNIVGSNWSVQKYKKKSAKKEKENDDEKKEDAGNEEQDGNVEIEYDWHGYGKSHIYGPNGTKIAWTDNLYDNTIIYAELQCGGQ